MEAQGLFERFYNVILYTSTLLMAVGIFVHTPILIIIKALNDASHEKKPIMQGVSFGFVIFIMICILDFVTGGTFLVFPIFFHHFFRFFRRYILAM